MILSDDFIPFSDAGNCYFTGNYDNDTNMYQAIDLTMFSNAIDQSKVSFNLSAWLGGYYNQFDVAVVSAEFMDSSNAMVGNSTIGPVTPVDRNNDSALLFRQATGVVPVNTRTTIIFVQLIGATNWNDGSVDDLSFKLNYVP